MKRIAQHNHTKMEKEPGWLATLPTIPLHQWQATLLVNYKNIFGGFEVAFST